MSEMVCLGIGLMVGAAFGALAMSLVRSGDEDFAKIERLQKCPCCFGTGVFHDYYDSQYFDRHCLACNGTGKIPMGE